MPYPSEHACRLVEPGKVDVLGSEEREHDGKKYRVIYGKPKGGDGSVEQAYRYPLDEGWKEAEARAHCRAHDGILFEPATKEASGAGVELRFWAAVHSIETGEEERLATFYLMNTTLNRNNWRVTDKALEEALPSLLGKALGCIPGYRVNHIHEPLQVGRWVRTEKSGNYALATAEITDEVAWEKLSSGEWGPISVVIRAFKVTCSKCGEDITGGPDEHVPGGEGHEIIESFTFDRVDFVNSPAYSQAGIITVGHLAESVMYGLPPGYHASQSKMDGPQGAQGVDPNPDEEEEKKMEAKVEELQQELETLKTEIARLTSENADLKERLEACESGKPEVAALKDKLQRIEAERHQERVDAAVEARAEAGLVKDREAEAERLKELDDATLILLAEDAGKIAEKLAKAKPIGPKAKYTAETATAFDAAVEDARMRLFGYRKEADA